MFSTFIFVMIYYTKLKYDDCFFVVSVHNWKNNEETAPTLGMNMKVFNFMQLLGQLFYDITNRIISQSFFTHLYN